MKANNYVIPPVVFVTEDRIEREIQKRRTYVENILEDYEKVIKRLEQREDDLIKLIHVILEQHGREIIVDSTILNNINFSMSDSIYTHSDARDNSLHITREVQ